MAASASQGPLAGGWVDRDRLVCIGRVSGAHGLQGEIKVVPLTTTPDDYRAAGALVLDTMRGLRAFDVETLRDAGGHWVLKLKGLTGRDAADALKGAEVLVDAALVRPPGADEYFAADLVGCRVETVAGAQGGPQVVGTVTGVMDAGVQHLLRVSRAADGGVGGAAGAADEVLVPLADSIVKEVDLGRRTIRIDPPPGLLELNRP